MKLAMASVLLVLLSLLIRSNAKEEAFDARHGTRSPTKKRIKELENLAAHLEVLLREAEEQNLSLEKLPVWLKGWKSPWKGKLKGGELIIQGEDELYDLGIRTRARFPNLFNDDYHLDVYAIKATQVPRASASAVAFGMGLFSGKGSLGPGRHRAFAVTSESRASDTMLSKKAPQAESYKAGYTSLWFLCKQEASLLNIVDQACALFSPSEVSLLEWTDDLEAFILKGYGKSINYRMGVPLLEDAMQSMEQAIKAEEEKHAPGSYEKARLSFAHAETVVPFSCLLGLFLDGSEFQKIQREQSLQLPPMPPQKRNWRGNTVAPFGGNNMLVLYSCPANTSNKHFVRVLHNEHPIPMPGCDGTDFCPLDMFKERIVAPHLKHDYNSVCNVKLEQQEQKPVASKLSQLWMFSLGNGDKRSLDEL
ncbi:unnamed protein product [Prunus armeniaca]|uniref:Multiple inositol polyphosphate phosphatase 1 n=1 Tax=Prunus armeniaca TaxID=36596 RepID=A0A6J5XI97_PRUAR|nr:unnamed protein product [Prunus armeniaca]